MAQWILVIVGYKHSGHPSATYYTVFQGLELSSCLWWSPSTVKKKNYLLQHCANEPMGIQNFARSKGLSMFAWLESIRWAPLSSLLPPVITLMKQISVGQLKQFGWDWTAL